jgi:uncharacterized membrane protein
MRNLSTTVAVYDQMPAAEADWDVIEENATNGVLDLADAALVTRDDEGIVPIKRQAHEGWAKGAVAGAIIGLLFPPSILGSALVGAGAGGLLARLNRSLDRGDLNDMGRVMDEGTVAIVVVTSEETSDAVPRLLRRAKKQVTKQSSTAEDLMAAMESSS